MSSSCSIICVQTYWIYGIKQKLLEDEEWERESGRAGERGIASLRSQGERESGRLLRYARKESG